MLGAERGLRLLNTWLPFNRQTHNWLQLICTVSVTFDSADALCEVVTLSSERRLYKDLVAQLQDPVLRFMGIFGNFNKDKSPPLVFEQQPFEESTVLIRSGAQSLIISARISGCNCLVSQ